jgi:hypothetical protein
MKSRISILPVVLLAFILMASPRVLKAQAATSNYFDDFSRYAPGLPPYSWIMRGTDQITPTIIEVGGSGSAYRLVSFPEVPWQYWDKWLLKGGLILSGSFTVETKMQFRNSVADRAGLTIAWNNTNWDRIDIQPNVYGDDIEFRVTYTGPNPSTVAVSTLASITVNAYTDYWLKVVANDLGPGQGIVDVYWSANHVQYIHVLHATGLANLTGMVGLSTAGPHMPNTYFDDFQVTYEGTGLTHPYSTGTDGFQFVNNDGLFTWDMFRDIYGANHVEVNLNGQTQHEALADAFFKSNYECTLAMYQNGKCGGKVGIGGNCLGMSSSSSLLFTNWTAFPVNGVSRAFDLPNPGTQGAGNLSQLWNPTPTSNLIVKNSGYWYGREILQAATLASKTSIADTLNSIITTIDQGLVSPDILIIAGNINGKCAAHALVPYNYQSGTTSQISVYDPNRPYTPANPGATFPTVNVNSTSSTWSYDMGGGVIWNNTQCPDSFYVIPASLWRQSPTPPWLTDLPAYPIYIGVSGADAILRDGSGHLLGYQNGSLVSQITDGMPLYHMVTSRTIANEGKQEFVINGNIPLTIDTKYTDMNGSSIEVWGNNLEFSEQSIPLTAGYTDHFLFDLDQNQEEIQINGPAESRLLDQRGYYGGSEFHFQVSGFGLEGTPSLARLQVGSDGNTLSFFSSTIQSGYNVLAENLGGITEYAVHGPAMQANDTQTVIFDWNHSSTVTIQIDHGSDGTIDQVIVVPNTITKIYLPIIGKIP